MENKESSRPVMRAVKLLFIVGITVILASGIVRALFWPTDINTYEARYARKLIAPTAENVGNHVFMDHTELVLADQIPLSQYMKKAYNAAQYLFQKSAIYPIMGRYPGRYFNYNGVTFYNGRLVSGYELLETNTATADAVIEDYNAAIAANPDMDYYLFYAETGRDIDLETGEKTGMFEYLRSELDIPEQNAGRFEISSYEDMQRYYYETDGHWNWRGSYQGYLDLLALLGSGDDPVKPVDEIVFPYEMTGSQAHSIGFDYLTEKFTAYIFDYMPMETVVNGEKLADLCKQEEYLGGNVTTPNYSDYYCSASVCGLDTYLCTGRPEKDSILLIGDSFNFALLKLMASHYNYTYYADLRQYVVAGGVFNLTDFLAQHDVDAVVLSGSLGVYTSDGFKMES